MTDNVKAFVAKVAPRDEVIALLERWLERARAGDVQAMALVGIRPGGIILTEWIRCEDGSNHELVSGCSILQHRVIAKLTDD